MNYKGYTIHRVDNTCYEVEQLTSLGFTSLVYAQEYIDNYLTDAKTYQVDPTNENPTFWPWPGVTLREYIAGN